MADERKMSVPWEIKYSFAQKSMQIMSLMTAILAKSVFISVRQKLNYHVHVQFSFEWRFILGVMPNVKMVDLISICYVKKWAAAYIVVKICERILRN